MKFPVAKTDNKELPYMHTHSPKATYDAKKLQKSKQFYKTKQLLCLIFKKITDEEGQGMEPNEHSCLYIASISITSHKNY